ncbi:hypothetical protein ACOME3_003057 [Neoechinorhynchus agilis]
MPHVDPSMSSQSSKQTSIALSTLDRPLGSCKSIELVNSYILDLMLAEVIRSGECDPDDDFRSIAEIGHRVGRQWSDAIFIRQHVPKMDRRPLKVSEMLQMIRKDVWRSIYGPAVQMPIIEEDIQTSGRFYLIDPFNAMPQLRSILLTGVIGGILDECRFNIAEPVSFHRYRGNTFMITFCKSVLDREKSNVH